VVRGLQLNLRLKRVTANTIGVLLLCVVGVWALDNGAPPLRLEPAPKEVQLRDGEFHVKPGTKIFVQFGHQTEDRIAAETLVEQIADQSGLQLDIVGEKPTNKAASGAIMLARLDDKRVRRFLAENGLKADAAVGDDGYLLFSDKEHLIVAANTGQGIFYGVQTLRQLLRQTGKGLLCPAVEIRDWPTQDKTAQQKVTRETLPESLKDMRGPHE
jgi:N-acetyl-beta-hexosaminidase